MDNFNALSKSAILTKLALDGYFIDLLTLNSFIKEWQIEAIYENEFGVEFFDNTSYEAILNKLKEKYDKTKDASKENIAEDYKETAPEMPVLNAADESIENTPSKNISANDVPTEAIITEALDKPVFPEENYSDSISLDDLAKSVTLNENKPVLPEVQDFKEADNDSVSLDEIQNAANFAAQKEADTKQSARIVKTKDTIMPRAMKRLTPSPASPMSSLNLNHSYDEVEEEFLEDYTEEFVEISSEENFEEEVIQNESFTQEEIEKADNLINNASSSKNNSKETVISSEEKQKDGQEGKDELDLMQLAQTFAQNLTGGPSSAKDVPPADLEQIFNESYVEPFEELQDFVRETSEEENNEEFKPEEYKSLQEGVPSDVIVPEVQPNVSLMPKEMNTASLTAQDIRDIIRDEISKQTANVVPKPQNGEDIREIIREIVKQATEIAPQNAFKLDISHGTLDMIAKSIAKKIAIKLNSYYKLNSTKQNAKLQQFRERTIELKERNQTLAEENKKLKLQLMETKEVLSSYKPSIFGLFKFTGKKRR